jgi:hypothetical protein
VSPIASFVESIAVLFSDDPSVLFVQTGVMLCVSVVIFLVLFTLRDVMLRSDSFTFQVLSVLLVALLPIVGFLFYLLIRPSRTIADRRLERELRTLLERTGKKHHHPQQQSKKKEA